MSGCACKHTCTCGIILKEGNENVNGKINLHVEKRYKDIKEGISRKKERKKEERKTPAYLLISLLLPRKN